MCVLYVSFGSKVRPRTFGCVAMCSPVLFILKSRLLVFSTGSGVNRVQVVLAAKTLCKYGRMYFFAAFVLVCVDVIDGDVICVVHDLNRCSGWWQVCSVHVK